MKTIASSIAFAFLIAAPAVAFDGGGSGDHAANSLVRGETLAIARGASLPPRAARAAAVEAGAAEVAAVRPFPAQSSRPDGAR
jgi:hypothetical protein